MELSTFLQKNHYALIKTISAMGESTFGDVYLIKDSMGTPFALKKIVKSNFHVGDYEIASKLKHGYIMQTYGMEEINPFVFVVSEYIENGSLKDYIKSQQEIKEKPKVDITIALLTQILTAVEFLHHGSDKIILHRDLKSANILLMGIPRSGVVGAGVTIKLADFGCAKELSMMTLSARTIMGTPMYMPPEIIAEPNFKGYDERADDWSVGVILYEMSTFRLPFRSSFAGLLDDMKVPITRPPEMNSVEWDGVWNVLQGLMCINPDDRLSSAEALTLLTKVVGEDQTGNIPVRFLPSPLDSKFVVVNSTNTRLTHKSFASEYNVFLRQKMCFGVYRVALVMFEEKEIVSCSYRLCGMVHASALSRAYKAFLNVNGLCSLRFNGIETGTVQRVNAPLYSQHERHVIELELDCNRASNLREGGGGGGDGGCDSLTRNNSVSSLGEGGGGGGDGGCGSLTRNNSVCSLGEGGGGGGGGGSDGR